MEPQTVLQVSSEETVDDLILGDYKVIQSRAGYRFSLDAVLLAHFAQLDRIYKAVDLGTGNGVIPLLLAARSPDLHTVGIEVQTAMVDRARRSLALNRLQNSIDIIQADVRDIPSFMPEASVQLVLSNPPFQRQGQGEISKQPEKALARHELSARLADFIAAAQFLLERRGKFCLIHRSERLPEALELFAQNKLGASRLRIVYSFQERDGGLFLLEGTKGMSTHLTILPPLVVYQEAGIYSSEVLTWYKKPDREGG